MKNFMFSVLALSLISCNGGMDPVLKPVAVETSPITNPDPTPTATPVPTITPTPTATPSPTPPPNSSIKSRVFVSRAIVNGYNYKNKFQNICTYEAKRAKLSGKFSPLMASTSGQWGSTHTVVGWIYQVVGGQEIFVAQSYNDLIHGNNEPIYANVNQQEVDTSVYNFAWTGTKSFTGPTTPDMNCKDWSVSKTGYGITGRVGQSGANALGGQYQECYLLAHVYCIETQ